MAKIEAHISKQQKESPFTTVKRRLAKALRNNDVKHNDTVIQHKIQGIYESLHRSFDQLIERTVEEPTEKRAREALTRVLPELDALYERAKQDLEKVKTRSEMLLIEAAR